MHTLAQWREALDAGRLEPIFRRCLGLPESAEVPEQSRMRLAKLLEAFSDTFRVGPAESVWLFSVPGRTELLGNHTDHQWGEVMAGSVNLDVWGIARLNGSDQIRFQSAGWPRVEVALADLETVRPEEFGSTRALLRGVAQGVIQRAKPEAVCGFDLYCQSEVLPGSGLSSSAAIEVLMGLVCSKLWQVHALGPVDWAKIGQQAENQYFGKPSGLMDQMACAIGEAIHIDFADPKQPRVNPLPLDLHAAGYVLCILDCGADHANLTDEYAAVPAEMGEVAAFFGASRLREVEPARFYAALPSLRGQLSDRALLRALHFYAECDRVQAAAQALEQGDLEAYLSLVQASGHSSWEWLQNIAPAGAVTHQAMALALAVCDRALAGTGAYRVHGGGFAGTLQAYVPMARLEAFKAEVERVLGEGACHVLTVRPAGAFMWRMPALED